MRVTELFATFLRYNPSRYDEGSGEIDFGSPDNRQIMDAIEGRTEEQKDIERKQGFHLEERLRDTEFPLINGRIRPQDDA